MQGLIWAWIGLVLLVGSIARGSEINVDVRPSGLDEASTQTLSQLILDHPRVKRRLLGSRYRIMDRDFSALIARTEGDEKSADHRSHLSVYDYATDRLLTITGVPEDPRIEESTEQLPPLPEEFEEAYAILKADPILGESIRSGERELYEAMPPTVDMRFARTGKGERVLAIGLKPIRHSRLKHEIVGVSLSRGNVLRFARRAPPTSLALDPACGWPSAGQANTARGVSGQADVTVTNGTDPLWKFTVIRPANSSGTLGSAIDLKNIFYKGKRVLSRLHVPILNVQYPSGLCGPYRDWQYSENPFEAVGTDIAPGIRRTTQPPRTIFESGADRGNFRGVAIHTDGDVTLLTTELAAGWYRYMNEYRFHADGTIEPVFKFSAVYNSCVCRVHNHHVYWRMDFDIGDATKNQIQVSDGTTWRPLTQETKQYRNVSNRAWRVVEVATGQGYEIVPGSNDSTADSYARGDAWSLRYRDGQVDDSRVRTSTAANLDAFNTGEAISSADVVFWYAAHFKHANDGVERPHIVGPTLKPIQSVD